VKVNKLALPGRRATISLSSLYGNLGAKLLPEGDREPISPGSDEERGFPLPIGPRVLGQCFWFKRQQ
jgi:hypothetical protein